MLVVVARITFRFASVAVGMGKVVAVGVPVGIVAAVAVAALAGVAAVVAAGLVVASTAGWLLAVRLGMAVGLAVPAPLQATSSHPSTTRALSNTDRRMRFTPFTITLLLRFSCGRDARCGQRRLRH